MRSNFEHHVGSLSAASVADHTLVWATAIFTFFRMHTFSRRTRFQHIFWVSCSPICCATENWFAVIQFCSKQQSIDKNALSWTWRTNCRLRTLSRIKRSIILFGNPIVQRLIYTAFASDHAEEFSPIKRARLSDSLVAWKEQLIALKLREKVFWTDVSWKYLSRD